MAERCGGAVRQCHRCVRRQGQHQRARGHRHYGAASGTLLNLGNASVVNLDAQGVTLNGDLIADASSSGSVALRNGTQLTGRIDPLSVSIDATSTWNVTASSEVAALSNAGTIAYMAPAGAPAQAASYKTITASSYAGNNGTIALNTYVAGDGAPSDRLVINGGSATGTTALRICITPAVRGARTTGDGINVVAATGGGTTAPRAFQLAAPVQAGAYQYLLYRGGAPAPTTTSCVRRWAGRHRRAIRRPPVPSRTVPRWPATR